MYYAVLFMHYLYEKEIVLVHLHIFDFQNYWNVLMKYGILDLHRKL